MSNIIDFNAARKRIRQKEADREEVAEALSNPMNTLMKEVFRQAYAEMGDNLLNLVPGEEEDGSNIFPEKDRVQLYKDLRDQLYETASAMDYVIETIEMEGDS